MGKMEITLHAFLILAATVSAVITEKSLSLLRIKSQPVTSHYRSIKNAHLLVCFDVCSLELSTKPEQLQVMCTGHKARFIFLYNIHSKLFYSDK
jgi:hypothetical protein